MGYMHIENLYKSQDILAFRWCWALEKVHGTSVHVHYRADREDLRFFSGGESHARFAALFDAQDLRARIRALGHADVTIYGEACGGSQQGMRLTYGDVLRFVAFDVRIGAAPPPGVQRSSADGARESALWLSVPDAAQVCAALGLEFVPYEKVTTDLADLDRARDAPSEVARRWGVSTDRPREGVVLRPPFEVRKNDGDRVIAKHKAASFSERATPQRVVDPTKLLVLEQAEAIAQEWVTPMRLTHVLDKLERPRDMSAARGVIEAMIADVRREAEGEVVWSREAQTAVGRRTSTLLREWLQRAPIQDPAPGPGDDGSPGDDGAPGGSSAP